MLYTYNLYRIQTGMELPVLSLVGTSFKPAQTPVSFSPLAPTSQLRREYFLLVLSPQFCNFSTDPHQAADWGKRKTDQRKRSNFWLSARWREG